MRSLRSSLLIRLRLPLAATARFAGVWKHCASDRRGSYLNLRGRIFKLTSVVVTTEGGMYRRVVSLLLLPSLLLTQSAALGHPHEDHQHNDPRPHFHLSAPDTGLCSRPSGPREHHHPHGPADDPLSQESEFTSPAGLPADHDSTAVFTSIVDLGLNTRLTDDAEYWDFPLWAAVWLKPSTALPRLDFPRQEVNWPPSPPPSGQSCPIFLRYSTLLI